MNIIDALNWRYATKEFTDEVLPRSVIATLSQAATLTATSVGLQPVRLVHVTDPTLREAMVAHSQPKVLHSSDVFVIAAQTQLGADDAEAFVQRVASVRGQSRESLDGFYGMVSGTINSKSPDQRVEWAKRQAYIVLGNLLTTCAVLEIDACPMEGFNPAGIDGVLGLADHGLTATVMICVGRRAPTDRLAKAAKVRLPVDDFVLSL
jgi:nitroreductase / dihydropteridine reductase